LGLSEEERQIALLTLKSAAFIKLPAADDSFASLDVETGDVEPPSTEVESAEAGNLQGALELAFSDAL
jgi:hypothetical protein